MAKPSLVGTRRSWDQPLAWVPSGLHFTYVGLSISGMRYTEGCRSQNDTFKIVSLGPTELFPGSS